MQTKQVHYAASNRIGKFQILYDTLENGRERPMLKALFALCTVLEAYPHESGRGTVYLCASELFQPLSEGEEVPEYRIEMAFKEPFANPERELARINSGDFGFAAIRKIILRVPPAQITLRARDPRSLH